MNLSDLTEVLRERADLADSSHEARMAGVRARVSATRRRRAVAGVAGVVLALVGIVYAVLPRADQPEPAVPPRSLPQYQEGTRLVAQAWGDLPTTSASTRFVPESMDFLVFTRCETPPHEVMHITVTINGHLLQEGNSCGGSHKVPGWEGFDIVVGQPSVITLTVDSAPPSGTFAVGIGEPVPVSEYPFPTRPPTPATFVEHLPEPLVELKSDADPLRRKELSVRWPGTASVLGQMNTPGRIQVFVEDVLVLDFSSWSYDARSAQNSPMDWKKHYGLDLKEGQTVKLTVVPERVTGDWEVTLTAR
ncbi:hypothetical protein [Lentzea sp. NPDC055074]